MILIIGAGVTGLSISASIDGNVTIVEKEDEVGGYCRTTFRNGFVWDKAGHFFHFKEESVKDFFDRNISRSKMTEVEKKTSILWKDIFIDFPFQNNIHQLPKDVYIDCLVDLYDAEKNQNNKNEKSFKDFLYSKLGKRISEEFLIPYNEKLYACNLDKLDKDAMGRFFPNTTFNDVLKNARRSKNDSYNRFFSYPKGGAKTFVDVLENKACKKNNILKSTTISNIDIEKKVAFTSSGEEIKYNFLINTVPLNSFLDICKINYDAKLSANKVVVFNLGFDIKVDNLDHHWVYFPGDEIFYRVGCYHNIFREDRASLYVEIGLSSDQDIHKTDLLDKVLADLRKTGFIDDKMKLIDYEYVLMNPAYVHINKESERFKVNIKNFLKEKNIYTAGRYGDWKYCSIEDNIVEGISLAKKIAKNESYVFKDFLSER